MLAVSPVFIQLKFVLLQTTCSTQELELDLGLELDFELDLELDLEFELDLGLKLDLELDLTFIFVVGWTVFSKFFIVYTDFRVTQFFQNEMVSH